MLKNEMEDNFLVVCIARSIERIPREKISKVTDFLLEFIFVMVIFLTLKILKLLEFLEF